MRVDDLIYKLAQFPPHAEIRIKIKTFVESKDCLEEEESEEDISALEYAEPFCDGHPYVNICVNNTISKENENG